MDSLLGLSPKELGSTSRSPAKLDQHNANINILIINNSFNKRTSNDSVDVSYKELYKSLSITAREIMDKLNAMLAEDLPDGIQSLKPADVTPEATANNIVTGATAFFDVFAKQNPDMQGEELLNKFMDTIRGGIKTGYNDAVSILEGLGAFEFDGVKGGIEETMQLVDEKLAAYEAHMRKALGIDPTDVEEEVASAMRDAVVTQAGAKTIDVAA